MMELLAEITRSAINNKIITYEDLYLFNEEEMMQKLKECNNKIIKESIKKFETITKEEIPDIKLQNVKIRKLNPIVNGKRYSVMV